MLNAYGSSDDLLRRRCLTEKSFSLLIDYLIYE